ncbi:MAG: hypothetical protein PUC65_08570 [Clostridiales bacterium]|nr:hypothetical protein [Clostridiales bacterium]
MNMDIITLEDCLINYEVNNKTALINDGHVIDFKEEAINQTSIPYILIRNE